MNIRKLAPGDRILDYRLLERLGEGGFGEVFRAEHEVLGRIVAIKVPRDQGGLTALRHEGVVQARLDHPNVVKTLELSISNDPPYVVMEFVDGSSLAELIRRESKIPWRRAARILLEAARALSYAHAQGVIHGDVKPGNIMVEPGRDGKVMLTDFGLGRVFEGPQGNLQISRSLELARSGAEVQGTIRYIAPEVLRGESADERADMYSFGVLVFETLTGRLPEGREVPTDLVPDLPPEFDRIFARKFTRRERRPRTLEGTIEDLERLCESAQSGWRLRRSGSVSRSGESSASSSQEGSASSSRPQDRSGQSGSGQSGSGQSGSGQSGSGHGRSTRSGHAPRHPSKTIPTIAKVVERVRAIPAESGATAPGALGAVRALPAESEGVIPSRTGQGSGAPSSGAASGGSGHEGATRTALSSPRVTAEANPRFARWRDSLFELVRERMRSARNVAAGDGHGFDVCFGVNADGEPHHRVYAMALPELGAEGARATVATARRIFEREKGIWEKEVTFCVLAQEVKDIDQVLWTFKNFSMGWWRRRRIMLHDLSNDRVYAAELGCDPRGNPLKRSFLAATQHAVQSMPAVALEPLPPMPRRRRRQRVRGTAWGAALALIMAFGLFGSIVAVDYANRSLRCKRSAPVPAEQDPSCCPGLPISIEGLCQDPASEDGVLDQSGLVSDEPGVLPLGQAPHGLVPDARALQNKALLDSILSGMGIYPPSSSGLPAEASGVEEPLRDPFRPPFATSPIPERAPDQFTPQEAPEERDPSQAYK
jgi:serine/threonine protein kinase